MRTVVWFSAGAASAVAAKLVLAETDAVLVYTDPGSEHSDNQRFIEDCEFWFKHDVIQLKSKKYRDTWQVWEERRFLNSPAGALCTVELKKKLRHQFQRPTDRQVFGYTADEQARADRFRTLNFEVDLWTPLIERGLTHADCLALVERAGIELPAMYRLGYGHANCVGCVKGGMGYWNKIRKDFPETFLRMSLLERDIGATVLRSSGESLYLDELNPDRGNFNEEPVIECSLLCSAAESVIEAAV